MEINFYKYQGTGNDFVILDNRDGRYSQLSQEQINMMLSKIPLGRTGKPDEVAALVHFLSSGECSFTTGQCYDISGGRATY